MAEEEKSIELGDFSFITLGGYDESFDKDGLCNKYSLLIKSKQQIIWYCGDNHNMPQNLYKYVPSAAISWTIPHTLERLKQVCPNKAASLLTGLEVTPVHPQL